MRKLILASLLAASFAMPAQALTFTPAAGTPSVTVGNNIYNVSSFDSFAGIGPLLIEKQADGTYINVGTCSIADPNADADIQQAGSIKAFFSDPMQIPAFSTCVQRYFSAFAFLVPTTGAVNIENAYLKSSCGFNNALALVCN